MGVMSTYGELKTALTDYYPRGGLSAFSTNLPAFVRYAHDEIMRALRIPLLQTTADLTIDSERVAVPSGFRAVGRLYVDNDFDTSLSPTSIENRMIEAAQYEPGTPRVYAIEGGDSGPVLAFAPRPSATVTGKLLYYRALDFFANDAATNVVLTRYPFLYFRGALAEAFRFDQFDSEADRMEIMFRSMLADVEKAERADALMGGVLIPQPSGRAV